MLFNHFFKPIMAGCNSYLNNFHRRKVMNNYKKTLHFFSCMALFLKREKYFFHFSHFKFSYRLQTASSIVAQNRPWGSRAAVQKKFFLRKKGKLKLTSKSDTDGNLYNYQNLLFRTF